MGLGDSYKLNWYGYKVPVGKKGQAKKWLTEVV